MTGPGDDGADRSRLEKQAIRKQILGAREAVDAAERERLSAVIASRLSALPELEHVRCVLAYLSFGHELSLATLIAGLQRRRCTVVLPRIDRAARRLELYRVEDVVGDTVRGVWGIREPDPGRCPRADQSDIDVVIAPGVAFTPAGDRLGYGGGYYDELLSRWQGAPPLLAGAFDLQIVAQLPVAPSDHAVDTIVTQSAVYRRARR